ncbi:hypothetical protein LWI28_027746 [Acer negundo]|uniref:Uncharacterized protein n=1 Tax=Acer negundo TaxID=4023 RepID=A0AAD5NT79_ACENE|nr:hypothetical protein LWI28_027746 [Acer negundo]
MPINSQGMIKFNHRGETTTEIITKDNHQETKSSKVPGTQTSETTTILRNIINRRLIIGLWARGSQVLYAEVYNINRFFFSLHIWVGDFRSVWSGFVDFLEIPRFWDY